MRPRTRRPFFAPWLGLFFIAALTMALALPVAAGDGSPGGLDHVISTLLEWVGLDQSGEAPENGDTTENTDDSEDPPLPSMGFEIEPNG